MPLNSGFGWSRKRMRTLFPKRRLIVTGKGMRLTLGISKPKHRRYGEVHSAQISGSQDASDSLQDEERRLDEGHDEPHRGRTGRPRELRNGGRIGGERNARGTDCAAGKQGKEVFETPERESEGRHVNKTLGKIAYEAYCKSREWKSVRGEPLPQFEAQSSELQLAWCQAAEAVSDFIRNATVPG